MAVIQWKRWMAVLRCSWQMCLSSSALLGKSLSGRLLSPSIRPSVSLFLRWDLKYASVFMFLSDYFFLLVDLLVNCDVSLL